MTEYIVLRSTDTDEDQVPSWVHVGDVTCRTPEKACDTVAFNTDVSGRYVAIPSRYFKPEGIEVFTKREIRRKPQ